MYKPSFGAERPKVITIPREFTGIADRAFEGWTSLQKVILPKGIEYIGHNAFNGCSSLQSVDIPKSVKEIGDWAFEECCSLRSVVIPEGVKNILVYVQGVHQPSIGKDSQQCCLHWAAKRLRDVRLSNL